MPPFSGKSFDTITGTFCVNGQPVWKGADQMSISVSDHTNTNDVIKNTVTTAASTSIGILSLEDTYKLVGIDGQDLRIGWNFDPAEAKEIASKSKIVAEPVNPKKEPEPAPLPVLDNYWKQGNSLVVKWTDGTITIVTAEDPERATLFAGICIAYVKKVLGSTTAISKQIDKVQQKKDEPRRMREIVKERRKELRKAKREMDAEIRENKIRKEMEDILIHQEAANRAFDKTLKEAKAKHADFDKDKEKHDSEIAKAIMLGDAQEDDN